jgi:hypothetical protein
MFAPALDCNAADNAKRPAVPETTVLSLLLSQSRVLV